MLDEEREELERLLDDLDALQTDDGARQLRLPSGATLTLSMPPDLPDVYAEAEVMPLPDDACDRERCRDLATLNFFWHELEGFVVALRDGKLMAEAREDLARLADYEALEAWLVRADKAVCAIRAVATAPRTAPEGAPEEDAGPGAEPESKGEEVVVWP